MGGPLNKRNPHSCCPALFPLAIRRDCIGNCSSRQVTEQQPIGDADGDMRGLAHQPPTTRLPKTAKYLYYVSHSRCRPLSPAAENPPQQGCEPEERGRVGADGSQRQHPDHTDGGLLLPLRFPYSLSSCPSGSGLLLSPSSRSHLVCFENIHLRLKCVGVGFCCSG